MSEDQGLTVEISQTAPIPLSVAFHCGANEVLAVFGPSGSGKTTLLRCIAGLHRPQRARVTCDGDTWVDTTEGRNVPTYRRRVGFMFQDYALFPHLTAAGNVMTALGHRPRAERRRRAEQLLAMVHLADHFDRRPAALSGGERQRVAVARALAREPAVLLMDEPFAAIDHDVRRRLQDEIDSLRQAIRIPMVLVTHDFDDVMRLATHLLILERGQTIACGPLPALMRRPDLTSLRKAVGLGSVFDAVVARTHPSRGLVELTFDGGTLWSSDRTLAAGMKLRLRIPAREVILATQPPVGISLHNSLSGTVSAIHADPAFDHVIVQVAVGKVLLLAEVTRDAVATLNITVGTGLQALIKSVSIDVLRADARANDGAP